jgi:hypothetical protein
MSQNDQTAGIPRSLSEIPQMSLRVGLHYFGSRSAAMGQFWTSCAEIREPTDLFTAEMKYWLQLVSDVQAALTEGWSAAVGPLRQETNFSAPADVVVA